MENVITGTNEVVKQIIADGGTAIIDFYAEWCGPCRALGPVLDSIAQENSEIKVVKVNVDDNSELTAEFGVRSIPAVYIYKGGEKTGQFVGMKGKEEIKAML